MPARIATADDSIPAARRFNVPEVIVDHDADGNPVPDEHVCTAPCCLAPVGVTDFDVDERTGLCSWCLAEVERIDAEK